MSAQTSPRRILAATIGRNARRERREIGMTQVDVASHAGISVEHYSKIERGICLPSFVTFSRLTRALRVEPSTLLYTEHTAQLTIIDKDRRSAGISRRLRRADRRTIEIIAQIARRLSGDDSWS